jgi:hypothetical protein
MGKKSVRELILRAKDKGTAQVSRNLQGLKNDTRDLKLGWSQAGKAGKVALGAVAVATAAAGAATVGAGAMIIKTGAQVETYRIKLNTVLRDQEKANKLFNELVAFAAETPFELPGLIEAAIQLESFGHDAMELLPVVGDTAAAMGADITDAAMAYTQGVTGEMEMLKRFTITGAQLKDVVGDFNRGTVEGMEKAAHAIETLMRQRFSGGMEEMAKSWTGTLSMFSDKWFVLKQTIAEGGVFDTVKADLQDVLKFVDDFAAAGGIDAIAIGFNNAFDTIHDYFFGGLNTDFDSLGLDIAVLGVELELWATKAVFNAEKVRRAVTFKGFGGLSEELKIMQGEIGALEIMLDSLKGTRQPTSIIEAQRIFAMLERKGYADLMGGGEQDEKETEDKARALGQKAGAAFTQGLKGREGEGVRAFGPATLAGFIEGWHELSTAARQHYFENVETQHDAHVEQWIEDEQYKAQFTISQQEMAADHQRRIFSELGRYQAIYVKRGMHLGRALNSMLIRGAVEVGKAQINQMARTSKIEAALNAAKALSAAASFNFASAAKYAMAAVKFGAISGAAGLATAYLDNYADDREQALIGGRLDEGGVDSFEAGAATGRGRRFRGTASTVRTGNITNNYYININQNVGGDYIAGLATDEDILNTIQNGLNEGAVVVPG